MQDEPIKIPWHEFTGLLETDGLIFSLSGTLIFQRDGVIYEVDDLAPRKQVRGVVNPD